MIIAKKNNAYYLSFPAIDSTTPASYKTGISPVDTAYYKDGAGAWSSLAITDTASEIGSTGVYEIDLTAAEMNHDKVIVKFSVSGMADDAYQFDLRTKLTDDLNDAITAPTAAENRTEMDSNSTQLAAIVADTNELQTDDVPTLIAALPTAAENRTEMDSNSTQLAAIVADTSELQTDDVPGLIATHDAKLDTVDGIVDAILADTGELQTDDVPGLIAALNNVSTAEVNAQCDTAIADALNSIADAILNRDFASVSDTNARTLLNAARFLRNKWSIAGTTLTVTEEDDSTAAWTSTVAGDAAADPIVSSDPA